jgi:hypothetical protein
LRLGNYGDFEDLMTVRQLFEGGEGRAGLDRLLQLARRSGLKKDTAKALSAMARDAETEHDLSEDQQAELHQLRRHLEDEVFPDNPDASVANGS